MLLLLKENIKLKYIILVFEDQSFQLLKIIFPFSFFGQIHYDNLLCVSVTGIAPKNNFLFMKLCS